MDTAVRNKLDEILRYTYGGELSRVHAACLDAQADVAEGERREVVDYQRCMTHGTLFVRITPFVLQGSNGNHIVRFVVDLSDPSGEADGKVDCEAALATMDQWLATAAELLMVRGVPGHLRQAILNVNVATLVTVACP